ncbi:hypothetical protein D3C86_1120580 [compost metagenome]
MAVLKVLIGGDEDIAILAERPHGGEAEQPGFPLIEGFHLRIGKVQARFIESKLCGNGNLIHGTWWPRAQQTGYRPECRAVGGDRRHVVIIAECPLRPGVKFEPEQFGFDACGELVAAFLAKTARRAGKRRQPMGPKCEDAAKADIVEILAAFRMAFQRKVVRQAITNRRRSEQFFVVIERRGSVIAPGKTELRREIDETLRQQIR